jgi:rhodanese-related sulfurtransferase/polyisoprenoid-binding protein YceI
VGKAKGYSVITPRELQQGISSGRDIVLIDTLPEEQFNKRHLPGANNACVFEVTFPDQVKEIVPDREREIVLFGSSDKSVDAVTAAEKLVRLGYRKVYVLKGGIAAWQEGGFPLEGEHVQEVEVPEDQLQIEDGTYKVNRDESVIEWTGRNPNTKHYGTLQLSRGEITVKDGIIGGSFDIDMKSIKNINLEGDELQPVLISHLESDDFFFVKLFPKAFFKIKTATPVKETTFSSPNFKVRGTLELQGIKKGITFPATVNPLPDGGATVEAHFDVDRTRWGVIYGSSRFFEHLGMHLVFDLISIQLRLVVGEREMER